MATAPEDEAPELSEQGRRRLGIAVGFNTALVPTAITIIVPALPQLTAELKTDPPTAALNLTLYAAISGVQPLLAGPLSDRIGRRPVLLCSHLLWAVSCLMCALAPNVGTLVAFRCLQAVGCSSLMVVGMGSLGDAFASAPSKMPQAFATNSQYAILGLVCAPTVGGAITEWFGWRGVFVYLLVLGGVCGTLTYLWLPETLSTAQDARPAVDLCMPLRSLRDGLGTTSLAIVSGGVATCHGVMFLNQIITPLSVAHLTTNELFVGMAMLPDAMGAMAGASLGGRLTAQLGEKAAIIAGGCAEGVGLLLVGWFMGWSCADGDATTWSNNEDVRESQGTTPNQASVGNRNICEEVREVALVLGLIANALIGLGLSCNRVGATTYAMKARPHARASVAGATRFVQMMAVSVMVQGGAILFGKIGQGLVATIGTVIIASTAALASTVPPPGGKSVAKYTRVMADEDRVALPSSTQENDGEDSDESVSILLRSSDNGSPAITLPNSSDEELSNEEDTNSIYERGSKESAHNAVELPMTPWERFGKNKLDT